MALWTVLIAIAVSLGEILSKYERRVFRDIINWYVVLYLSFNGIFAYATYCFLPGVADYFLKPEQIAAVQGSTWTRVFVSAFGYMVIVRAKVFTIKDTAVGLDTLYNSFAQYCLRHTNMVINNRRAGILDDVFANYNALAQYQSAFEDRLPGAPDTERETLRAQRDTVISSQLNEGIKCKRLGELILQIVGTKEELIKALKAAK